MAHQVLLVASRLYALGSWHLIQRPEEAHNHLNPVTARKWKHCKTQQPGEEKTQGRDEIKEGSSEEVAGWCVSWVLRTVYDWNPQRFNPGNQVAEKDGQQEFTSRKVVFNPLGLEKAAWETISLSCLGRMSLGNKRCIPCHNQMSSCTLLCTKMYVPGCLGELPGTPQVPEPLEKAVV